MARPKFRSRPTGSRWALGAASALLVALAGSCDGCSDRVVPAQLPEDAAERYADRLCAAEAACGCARYASVEACEADVIAAFEAATEAISGFDEACFEEALETLEERACSNVAELILDCVAIRGAGSIGEACERDPRLRAIMPDGTCEAGASCDLQRGLCASEGAGDPPAKQIGDPCIPHHLSSCGFELYCAADGSCQARTADGEPCSDPFECELLSFCEGASGQCRPQLEPGEPCDPGDWSSCATLWTPTGEGGAVGESSWCNPQSSVCEAGERYVCAMLDYPFVP